MSKRDIGRQIARRIMGGLVVIGLLLFATRAFALSAYNVPNGASTALPSGTSSVMRGHAADVVDQRYYFTSRTDETNIYYNTYDDSGTAWEDSTSLKAITMAGYSLVLGDVLYNANPIYYSPDTNIYYKWLMYFLARPTACDGVVDGGFIMAAFSTDGKVWTTPSRVGLHTDAGAMTEWPCFAGNPAIAASGVGAFFFQGKVTLVYSQGDVSHLMLTQNSQQSHTWAVQALPTSPAVLGASGFVPISMEGLFSPNLPNLMLPAFFKNLSITYDNTTGFMYISRSYSFPFDLAGTVPCGQTGCETGIFAAPTRVQVYKIYVGNPVNLELLASGQLMKLQDWGAAIGYPIESGGACVSRNIVAGQVSNTDDFDNLSFGRDTDGTLHSDLRVYLGNLVDNERTDTADNCTETANDKQYYDTLP